MIAGVDYDTNRIAVCLLEWDDDTPWFRTVTYRHAKQDAFEATAFAYKAMRDLLRDKAPGRAMMIGRAVDAWWIEHAFGKGPTDFKLGRVQGAIVAALARQVQDPVMNEVGPSEWKKGVGLPGNAGKAAYVPTLRERIGDESVTEHECDAYGIAWFGRQSNLAVVA